MAYQRPMVTVDQNITTTPTSIERDQPAFVFGPNYELHRYENADEKSGTAVGPFSAFATRDADGSLMKAAYPKAVDGRAVDAEYTKLFGDNVVVKLADLGVAALPEEKVPDSVRAKNGGYTKLLFVGKKYLDYDTSGADVGPRDKITTEDNKQVVLPENLAVGNVLLVTYTEDSVVQRIKSKIVEVKYQASDWNLDTDSSYEGAGGTLVTIDDAIPETVNLASDVTVSLVSVHSGVEFTRKNIAALSHGDGDPGYQWTQGEFIKDGKTEYGVFVNNLSVEIVDYFLDDTYCTVLSADLFVTYRELVTAYSDTFHSLYGASEVAGMLGAVDPDNPLAMGVYMAALNAATDDGDESAPIYFMATPSADAAGYDAVLNKATLTDRAYVFAPTTRDEAVLEKLRAHVLEMSTKTVKMWRIAAASAIIPETVDRLSSADNLQGKDYFAIPVSDKGTVPEEEDGVKKVFDKIRVVKAKDDTTGNTDTAFRSTLVVGDRVRFGYHRNAWEEMVFDTYVIDKIINNYTVQVKLVDGNGIDVTDLPHATGASTYTPTKVEIYHVYTSRESAEVAASVSKAMATRRMLNVFPGVFRNDGVTMTGEFAACAVAGLISATEPQQPITNMTVRGIDDIPIVYQTYNNAELDLIASGGTFIIMQDLPADRVYVRHQITTAYPDGNLNTAELSITKNVDHISYAFAELFRPYYGRNNITNRLLATFRNISVGLISRLARERSVYGPQLIANETEIQYIRQNELMKDHVDIGIRLGVPYPCNNIDIVLTV